MTPNPFSKDAKTNRIEHTGADRPTLDFYARHSAAVTERYEAAEPDGALDRQMLTFLKGAGRGAETGSSSQRAPAAEPSEPPDRPSPTLLDVGLGSGRDLARWIRAGFDGYGVDASRQMLDAARMLHPELTGRLHLDALPDLSRTPSHAFDAVICHAVLMHLAPLEIQAAVASLRRVLRDGGRLVVSIPLQGPPVDDRNRSLQDGRLYTPLSPDELNGLLAEQGFRAFARHDSMDTMGRPGRSWATLFHTLT